jgi:UDP-N-acetylmuramate--alanine ligase
MLEHVGRIHFIGIGGIGISGAARIAMARGFTVTGSDVRESSITRALAGEGAQVRIGHHADHVQGADLVVVSTAIPADNLEWHAAKARAIPVVHRSEILAELARGYRSIGVTGTHGKGTVSAMLTWILQSAGLEPGFVIGGVLRNYGTNTLPGGGQWMVLEVDESDGSHHRMPTDYLVCNYLEADHLNYYDDLQAIIDSMVRCLDDNPRLVRAFANGDCAGNRELAARVRQPVVLYGLADDSEVRGVLEGDGQFPIRFAVHRRGEPLGTAELAIPGRYNVTNALGALAVALELGVPFETARAALATFQGLENRFTIVRAGGLTLVKDYISHPTGLRRVLESASDLTSGRVFSVWKPYRYTLLNYLQDEYATAFEGSTEVLITTMYAAEEDPIPGIDTGFIVEKIRSTGMPVTFVPRDADLVPALEARVRPGDQVIFFGGDDFFQMADAWAQRLGDLPTGG